MTLVSRAPCKQGYAVGDDESCCTDIDGCPAPASHLRHARVQNRPKQHLSHSSHQHTDACMCTNTHTNTYTTTYTTPNHTWAGPTIVQPDLHRHWQPCAMQPLQSSHCHAVRSFSQARCRWVLPLGAAFCGDRMPRPSSCRKLPVASDLTSVWRFPRREYFTQFRVHFVASSRVCACVRACVRANARLHLRVQFSRADCIRRVYRCSWRTQRWLV
jgi:hypothetical protein|mmetsp:Transcript_66293/g.110755  ORF Transcript_66293/g.110755 Transcript_66293/m.110755 type:complete len:215 (+) Transcript_66293:599-1243(+)